MAAKKHKKADKSKLIQRLKKHYRLVIMNDENFEIRTSVKLTPFNVIFIASSISLLLIILIVLILIFTPLRQFIPGYEYKEFMNQELVSLKLQTDSLQQLTKQQGWYINNIRNIVSGHVDTSRDNYKRENIAYDSVRFGPRSSEDSMLRAEMESNSEFQVSETRKSAAESFLEKENLFKPVDGILTNHFNPELKHYGVDIVTQKNHAVKAVLRGKVFFADWTLDDGYVIAIQHQNNLVSIYKHNAVLMKKVGSFVESGDVIASVGNSGELSQGPHLHFELWYNLVPVNPEKFMNL